MPSAMKLPREMPPSQFAVRVGPQELGHIVGLRRNLEHAGALAEWAERYLKLGWPLVALEAATGGRLQVDFSRPRQIWRKALMDASLQGRKVSLAVRLGAFSRLFVLRVETCRGRLRLDRLGDWRSPWVAAAGAREQHFYLKPLTWRLSGFQDPDIALLGETRPALVPPSRDVGSRHPWRWLQAPWETPPPLPPPGLCRFLKQHGLISSQGTAPERRLPAWRNLFVRLSACPSLLGALACPHPSSARYYQRIIAEAWKAGFREPEALEAILWHAPYGEARRRPEQWCRLLAVVAQVTRAGAGRAANPRQTRRSAEGQAEGGSERGDGGRHLTASWHEWLALIQRPFLPEHELQEFQQAVVNFLRANPDLVRDEGKLRLVRYCYANYINPDPGYDGLPPAEKLARAGEMARSLSTSWEL